MIRVKSADQASKTGFSELILNDDGMPIEIRARLVTRGRGGERVIVKNAGSKTRLSYVKLGDRHAISRMDSEVETGGTKLVIVTQYEYTRSGERHVCSRVTNTMKNLGSVGPRRTSLKADLYDYEFTKAEPANARKK